MASIKSRSGGWLMYEILIALAVIGVLLAALAIILHGYNRAVGYQWLKHRCVAAAQAQLDAVASGNPSLGEADIERLWPGVELTVSETAGAGQWEGLTLVEIRANAAFSENRIEVRLSRYLPPLREK